jgi:hypothetical protein
MPPAKAYRDGSRFWQSSSAAKAIDEWLQTNESRVLNWLSDFIRTERDAVQQLDQPSVRAIARRAASLKVGGGR